MKVTRLLPEPALGLQLLLAPSAGLAPNPGAVPGGVGSLPWGGWQGHCLSPQGHSCARSAGLCGVMGSQSCFGGGLCGSLAGSPHGLTPGWWHTMITPWRWPSLGTLVTGCAQAGGNSSSWGGWAWARAQHRWHLSPGGLHCHSSPPPSPRAPGWGLQGEGTEGQWWVVTTLGSSQSMPVTDPGASSPLCRNGNKQPF